MNITTKKWDAGEYLDSPEMIREYLQATIEEGDTEALVVALGNIAKARGMTELSNKTNLNRQHLYRALSADGSPKLETIVKILKAFDLKLTIEPIEK